MDEDRGYPDGRVPLGELGGVGPRSRARRDSIRKVRRVSNVTAAALMIGAGAAAVALAHQSFPAAAPAPVAGAAGQVGGAGTSAGQAGAGAQAAGGPRVSHSVATTTASGVTVTTTTTTVNGKTAVTQVRHGPGHRDN